MKWFSDDWLTVVANAASIITAAVATVAYANYRLTWCRKKKRLEDYLRQEKESGHDKGQRTVLQIVREVGISESDIMACAFEMKTIARRVRTNKETGLAEVLFLEYVGKSDRK